MGTSAFLQLYEALGLQWKTARFTNVADPVPLVPRESDGFVHVGQLCPLGQPAWHQASVFQHAAINLKPPECFTFLFLPCR